MDISLLETIRTSRGFVRSTSYLVIIALVGLLTERFIYYSLESADVIAPEDVVERINRVAPHKARLLGLQRTSTRAPGTEMRAAGAEAQLSGAVLDVTDALDVLAYALINDGDPTAAQQQLVQLADDLRRHDQKAMEAFAEIRRHITDRSLDREIEQRHADAVQSYRAEMDGLLGNLAAIQASTPEEDKLAAVLAAREQLEAKQLQRAHQPFDPEQLPHGSQRPNPDNQPRTDKKAFTQAGLFDNPYPKLAALGDFTFDNLPGANDPAYLAESAEVTLTQAVRDQAARLNHDPVAIYHWVRNNVEWIPSWGAVQSADIMLGSRRGNAMDIAGLTIALLRASGIPARYVHGTIDVPPDAFRNWSGGFDDLNAAMNYAASGGIPVTALISGGTISAVRMEHVWVEAALDYFPSRAAINRDADSWVAMGPSFKQYEYQQGLDVAGIAGLDPDALGQSFLDSGTVDEAEGWVQGFDANVLETAQQQAQAALEAHIANNMTDPTVGDVIGGRKVIVKEYPGVPSSLPNRIVVEGARYAELPNTLRPKLALGFGADLFGSLTHRVEFPWAAVNNHKVTLSFKPATTADGEALASLLPEGEITDLSQLPNSIPGYLIKVVPEIKVDGEVKLTGDPIRLGEDLNFAFDVTDPVFGNRSYPSPVVAGSYLSIAVVGANVSPKALSDVQAVLESTKGKLESQDQALLAGLTREDILGDVFHAGTLGYFAEYSALANLMALQQGNHVQLATSVGTYGYVPQVNYFFGIPRSIEPGGVEMDLDRVAHAGSVDGKGLEASFNFTFQLGALASALEHGIPEQMFVTPESPGEGVSAVKALQKASAQGQRIYHITAENQATILPSIHHSSATMQDIRQALAVGKEVITHSDPISVPGWTGAGYVIYDPDVGDGAWMIGGGTNGGFLVAFGITAAGLAIGALLMVSGVFWLGLAIFAWELLNAIMWINAINSANSHEDFNRANAGQALVGLLGLIPFAVPEAVAVQWFGIFFSWLLVNML